MSEKRVKSYYAKHVQMEWKRLTRDAYHRVEFDTTLHFLEEYLPKKGLILDAGCGPGRYAIELAKRGYKLVLFDLTPANLDLAKRKVKSARVAENVRDFVAGSITDLSEFAENSFDAVVCLGGPLSHVLNKHKRDRAVTELIRVCKRGAPLFVSVMGRLSVLVTELQMFPEEIEQPLFKTVRDGGDYAGTSGFTACHFFLPEELESAFSNRRAKVIEMVGLEGLGSHHARQVNSLAKNPKRWRIWQETHYLTCTHPSVVGTSEHMMIICRK